MPRLSYLISFLWALIGCSSNTNPGANVDGAVALDMNSQDMTIPSDLNGTVPNGSSQWIKVTGGSNYTSGFSLAADSSNNIYIAEESSAGRIYIGDDYSYNNNSGDFVIAKLDPKGTVIWSRGGYPKMKITSMEMSINKVDASIVITGSSTNGHTFGGTVLAGDGLYLAKTAADGAPLWAKRIICSACNVGPISQDATGNIYLSGSYTGSVDFVDTLIMGSGYFIAKYSGSGSFIWAKRISTALRLGITISENPDTNNKIYWIANFNDSITIDGQVFNSNSAGRTNSVFVKMSGDSSSDFVKLIENSAMLLRLNDDNSIKLRVQANLPPNAPLQIDSTKLDCPAGRDAILTLSDTGKVLPSFSCGVSFYNGLRKYSDDQGNLIIVNFGYAAGGKATMVSKYDTNASLLWQRNFPFVGDLEFPLSPLIKFDTLQNVIFFMNFVPYGDYGSGPVKPITGSSGVNDAVLLKTNP